MADDNAKSYLVGMIIATPRFLGSLIMNLSSKFRSSKWRIQYDRKNVKSHLNRMKLGTRDLLTSLFKYSSSIYRNSKFQMQRGGPKYNKQKLMPQMFLRGIHFSFIQMCIGGFLGSLIMNLILDFWNQYGVSLRWQKFEI